MNKDMIHEPRYFDNVRALVEWGADTYGNDNVYSFRPTPRAEVVKKTFVEFRDDVRALASEFLAMGCAGRHCAIIGKLSYEWALTYYAMLSIGGVLIPLDRDWQAEDLAATVERAEAKFLFCDADLKEKAAVIESKVSFATPTVYLGGKDDDVSLASLTEKGREIARSIFKAGVETQQSVGEDVPVEELKIFYSVLDRLADKLSRTSLK